MNLLPTELTYQICDQLTLKELFDLSLTDKSTAQQIQPILFDIAYKRYFEVDRVTYIHIAIRNFEHFKSVYGKNHHLFDANTMFVDACTVGASDVAEWLYETYQIGTSYNDLLFQHAWQNNYVGVVKLLIKIWPEIDIKKENHKIFRMVCEKGYVEVAQLLFDACENKSQKIKIELRNGKTLRNVCANGHLEMAKWLRNTFPQIDMKVKNNAPLRLACDHGHLEVAQWIIETCPKLDIHKYFYDILLSASNSGSLEVALWIVETCPKLDIREYFYDILLAACQNNHYKIAEWIVKICPDMKITNSYAAAVIGKTCEANTLNMAKWFTKKFTPIDIGNESRSIFKNACAYGHLKFAKWMINFFPHINNDGGFLSNKSFRLACEYGQLDVAKWLIQTYPKINIDAKWDYAYTKAKINNHVKIVNWLESLCPKYLNKSYSYIY